MPEAIKKAKVELNLPVNFDEAIAAQAAAIASRISAPSGDVIRINKDKTFSLPDGGTADVIEAVIVEFVSLNQYYPGKYDPKDVQLPVCMAIGMERKEMQPIVSSPQKQNADCHTCWASQWGSSGRGKACKEQRLLALLAPDAQDEGPLMLLKVSPTGTKYWDHYVGTLSNMYSTLPVKMVTRVSFAPTEDFATLRFGLVRPNDQWATAFGRHEEARKRLLTEPELAPPSVAAKPK